MKNVYVLEKFINVQTPTSHSKRWLQCLWPFRSRCCLSSRAKRRQLHLQECLWLQLVKQMESQGRFGKALCQRALWSGSLTELTGKTALFTFFLLHLFSFFMPLHWRSATFVKLLMNSLRRDSRTSWFDLWGQKSRIHSLIMTFGSQWSHEKTFTTGFWNNGKVWGHHAEDPLFLDLFRGFFIHFEQKSTPIIFKKKADLSTADDLENSLFTGRLFCCAWALHNTWSRYCRTLCSTPVFVSSPFPLAFASSAALLLTELLGRWKWGGQDVFLRRCKCLCAAKGECASCCWGGPRLGGQG